ncbi:hypothetical protein ABZ734_16375 [Streptomyces sp. NPDC006660]|uniref:hypothetical protein n=1 Tax=Streptomyces sp. NPDC006660 TaxID=3156901 RepID=UPI0033CF9392
MSGDRIAELRNTINATRVVSTDNDVITLEFSAKAGGTVEGHTVQGLATHVSKRYPDGTETATARIVLNAEGCPDQLVLTGMAAGTVRDDGSVLYEGLLVARATRGRFVGLNGKAIVGTAQMEADGTVTHVWHLFS